MNYDFERVKIALQGGTPDRIPLMEVLVDHAFKEAFLKTEIRDVQTDLQFWIEAGYDYINLGRRINGVPPFWNQATFENYYQVQAQIAHTPGFIGIIKNWEDFHSYSWTKPDELDFRIFDEVEKILPSKMKVIRYIGPIFQVVWMLMGLECFTFALVDDQKLVHKMFEKIRETVLRELYDALERDSTGAIWYLDDVGVKSGLMVDPKILRQYLFPIMWEIVAKCTEKGVPFIYHSDGNIEEIIPELIDMGVSAIHPLESQAMDIYQIKKQYGQKLCLIGNIDINDVLANGTVEDVIKDVKKHILQLSHQGGYCIGSSNSVTADIPIENFQAMVETTIKYGKYPVNF